jgi:type 1 glutamine amidotransferase
VRAVAVWGGYEGHEPRECVERFIPFLESQGFDVMVENTLAVYADAELMAGTDLILQCWTTGKPTIDELRGLADAVQGGAGLVGWHGGLCDSFRESPQYQFMTGGQWVAHPNGSESDYRVDVLASAGDDPIVAGISGFSLHSEQYYMIVDPAVEVLATTTFHQPQDAPWISHSVIPAVWKRRWGSGRVFYTSWGHAAADFDVPEARTIVERGLLWSSRHRAP